ncbi:hypothetical protein GCM10023224_34340 [Streptomonospora halophila]|uniref:Uncharacterized protein n=1 Tax=Streptomonospora halophila TaxID=427369 RepID=A0ABP9GQD0_9ACTN
MAAEVSVTATESGGFARSAALRVHIGGGIAVEAAESLTAAAHEVCPYSAATRGNVPAVLSTTAA